MDESSNKGGSLFGRVLGLAIVLALTVIVLGAYTRLSDAGLGCPDWPGCYGKISVPTIVSDDYQRPLEAGKAWKEMIHRYVAGTLGLLILVILAMVVKGYPAKKQTLVIPALLLMTVIFQALLGMWTVTLLLSPVVVTSHLIGGMTTLSLLFWLYLNQTTHQPFFESHPSGGLKIVGLFALLLVIMQILLGGWTSSNYAALSCGVDFPTCSQQWWPTMDFAGGFDITHQAGVNYEYGVLDSPERTAIQFMHRVGALIVFTYLFSLSVWIIKKSNSLLNRGSLLLLLLLTQVSLGIMNVVFALPLPVAVLHNLVAALLLLSVISVNHQLFNVEK